MINADKVTQWKQDVEASVDMYNQWFLEFAPGTYRHSRLQAAIDVKDAFEKTQDLQAITPAALKASPRILATLRMCTAPPLARDRLIGMASINHNLVKLLEGGKLPRQMSPADLQENLKGICDTLLLLLDKEIFPWLGCQEAATDAQRERAATIVADRVTGAVADPLVRNAQEARQLRTIQALLERLGYEHVNPKPGTLPTDIRPGTFCFRYNVKVKQERKAVNIPIDVVIQPKRRAHHLMPILIECKSAGDFTNTNKRRKEEATKVRQLKATYGADAQLCLFLCGYFDTGYLGYEAAEGLDWVWEHRIKDMMLLGL